MRRLAEMRLVYFSARLAAALEEKRVLPVTSHRISPTSPRRIPSSAIGSIESLIRSFLQEAEEPSPLYLGAQRRVEMFFFTVLIAWFYSTLLHEIAHATFAWKRGASVRIYPYPHMYQGRLYFARYTWEGGGPVEAQEHAAPLLFDALTIVAALLLMLFSDWLWPLFFVLTSLVDSAVWMHGYWRGGPHTDGQKFRASLRNADEPA
jgi:hypothetical protein